VLTAIKSTGLLPSTTHELVRNILVSPQTGCAGGRTDLKPVAASLDSALLADPQMVRLPGRFLFTLDDGRGDLLEKLTHPGRRGSDLGFVALTAEEGQLRIGDHWGEVVGVDEAALHLAGLAAAFLSVRGVGVSTPWHLRELPTPLRTPSAPDSRMPAAAASLSYGPVAGGIHLHVPDGVLTPDRVEALFEHLHATDTEVVVTPWHGVFIPRNSEVTP
jgi:precorrin-3B synthase